MDNLKPGYLTTEFWLTLVTSVLSLLVMAGVVGPNESGNLAASAKEVISGVVALIGIVGYVAGRVKLKSAPQA